MVLWIDVIILVVETLLEIFGDMDGLQISIGRISQDFVEHLFGDLRASVGGHNNITSQSALRLFKLWVHDAIHRTISSSKSKSQLLITSRRGNSGHVRGNSLKTGTFTTLSGVLPPRSGRKSNDPLRHERCFFSQVILRDQKVTKSQQWTIETWKPLTISKYQQEDAHHIFGVAVHRIWKMLNLPPIAPADEEEARIQLRKLTMKKTKKANQKIAQYHVLVALRSSREFEATPESCFTRALEKHHGKLIKASELTWKCYGQYLARGNLELVEGDTTKINRVQLLNRCCLLEHGGLKERWDFIYTMIAPSPPEGITTTNWEEVKNDIRRRIITKFFGIYAIDLGQRLNEENRTDHAHKPGDGGTRGPLRATQILYQEKNVKKAGNNS